MGLILDEDPLILDLSLNLFRGALEPMESISASSIFDDKVVRSSAASTDANPEVLDLSLLLDLNPALLLRPKPALPGKLICDTDPRPMFRCG